MVFEGLGDNARQAQQGESQHVVQQNDAHKRGHSAGGRRVKAQQHLQKAVDEARGQAPLHAVTERDEDKRQHGHQRNAAAEGHFEDLDLREYGAHRDHQRAFNKRSGAGIRFCCHREKPLFYVVT